LVNDDKTGQRGDARQMELGMGGVQRKKRVLVVDDQPRVTRFIEIYLKFKGFAVTATGSGLEALEMVRSWAPDIVLLEVLISGIDGFEVIRRLRVFSRVPVIAISSSPADYPAADAAGADDFLSKPFQTDEILARINRLLGPES
jgi:DNA-binding response OmpR family regulator